MPIPNTDQFLSSSVWDIEFRNAKFANQILASLSNIAPPYSPDSTAAIVGIVQTMKALNFMMLAETRDSLGVSPYSIDVANGTPAAVYCNQDVWAYIIALLDSANASLDSAGSMRAPGPAAARVRCGLDRRLGQAPWRARLPPSIARSRARQGSSTRMRSRGKAARGRHPQVPAHRTQWRSFGPTAPSRHRRCLPRRRSRRSPRWLCCGRPLYRLQRLEPVVRRSGQSHQRRDWHALHALGFRRGCRYAAMTCAGPRRSASTRRRYQQTVVQWGRLTLHLLLLWLDQHADSHCPQRGAHARRRSNPARDWATLGSAITLINDVHRGSRRVRNAAVDRANLHGRPRQLDEGATHLDRARGKRRPLDRDQDVRVGDGGRHHLGCDVWSRCNWCGQCQKGDRLVH